MASLCVVALLVVVMSVACSPFEHLAASAIVNAPNRGDPAPALSSGELAIPVGPPSAVLSVAIVDTPSPRATVFVLHGRLAEKESVAVWATRLAAAGFRAVLVDLRGHGHSTGDFMSYGVVEARDLMQVLDQLERRGLRAGFVGVMGFSYGGGIAIEWAGIDPRVAAVIAVAPFASLRAIVPEYAPSFLSSSFIDDAIEMAGRKASFDPDEASPLRAMAHTQAAVLLIHGADDHKIPPAHSRQLFEARRVSTELLIVEGAGHGTIREDQVIATRAPSWFAEHLAAPQAHVAE